VAADNRGPKSGGKMKRLLFISLLSLLPTLGSAGGILPCSQSDQVLVGSKSVLSMDGNMVLKILVTDTTLTCDSKSKKGKVVNTSLTPLNGSQIPKGGYLNGRYFATNQVGMVIDIRNYQSGFFVVSSYPFETQMKTLTVDIEGFERFAVDTK
jgi:hypothetical protein